MRRRWPLRSPTNRRSWSSTAPRWRACWSALEDRRHWPASPRARPFSPFASPAGNATRRRAGPSTAVPTSSWRGSSAPSTRTATATPTTPRASRSSASRSPSPPLRMDRSQAQLPAGPGYGSVAGPGGAPAALTVGALDLRPHYGQIRVVLRAALHVEFDGTRPLAGAVTPAEAIDAGIGAPRARTTAPIGYRGAIPLLDFFDRRGLSLVAGRVALLRAGADSGGSVANAARAGAVAVLFYGADLPAGGIGLDERG